MPGPQGAWAALALARRGDKEAVDRLLRFLGDDSAGDWESFTSRNLKMQVLVLLSNRAASSGVEQPERHRIFQLYLQDPGEPAGAAAEHYAKWWKEHRDTVSLADPWLEMLDRQRID